LTSSGFFPTTGDPFQPLPGAGFPPDDAFVAKLGPLSERMAATYLGGSGFDNATSISVDPAGFVYVAGGTSSTDFPTAGGPFQPALAGNLDAFVVRMDSVLAMIYSTYVGGALPDVANGVAADRSGRVVVAGNTRSPDWPLGGTPSQTSPGGGLDGFVARIFAPPGHDLFTVTPCRVVDTRDLGSPLFAGFSQPFAVSGKCGVPSSARSVVANVTVTQPTHSGHLRLFPAGSPPPSTSSLNYAMGQTRANNAVLLLSPQGRISVYCAQPSGTAHVIIDVTGYFE
jgi:hypothetical protein